ncbi:MAG: biotin/lipoyl-containing protein, partial [Rhodoglobus sp.]
MANSDFTLPDVGEGLTEAEIVSWKVKAGDTVIINQVLVEIETAKSLVELPSPFAGTVTALLVEEGQTVEVGTPIITVSSDGAVTAPEPVSAPVAEAVADAKATVASEAPAAEKSGAVLVGYGSSGHGGSRRRRGESPTAAPVEQAVAQAARPSSVPASAASPI